MQGLLAGLGAYLNTLQPLLTPGNYEQMVSLLLQKVIIASWHKSRYHVSTEMYDSVAKPCNVTV